MRENATCYELTLTQNYVSDWTFNDAIRELIQNGTDQATDINREFSVHYDIENKTLRLINKNSSLKVNTLLLGRSSKSNNEETVGQFGEGYKIAALVLNRLGKTFTVYNNDKNEVWESKFKNSEKWREKILAFYISKEETKETDLCIEIGNVSEGEWNDLQQIWLGFIEKYERVTTSYGEILTDEDCDFAGEIYVNGLYVMRDVRFEYGYNFKPKYIKLERDRKTCSSWDVGTYTSLMISEALVKGDISFNKVKEMIESQTGECYHLEYTTYNNNVSELQEMLIEAFDKQNPQPYSVPVSSQSDADRVKAYGGKPVIVPSGAMKLLNDEKERRIEELVEMPMSIGLTLKQRFNRWYEAYSSGLSYECKKEIKKLIEELE